MQLTGHCLGHMVEEEVCVLAGTQHVMHAPCQADLKGGKQSSVRSIRLDSKQPGLRHICLLS